MPYQSDEEKFRAMGITPEEPPKAQQDDKGEQPVAESQEAAQAPTDRSAAPEAAKEDPKPSRELPEKLRGKTAEEIAEMYLNLEAHSGKLAKDFGESKERTDEMLRRIQQLEASKQQVSQEPDQDPVALFKKEAAENPEQAIVNLVNRMTAKVNQRVEGIHGDLRVESAREFVQSELKNNPDFKENFDTMVDLEKQYGGIIKPEFAGTKIVYQLLHDLAKGKNVSRYEQRAVDRAKSQVTQIRSEKKAAFSESANASQGAAPKAKSPMDMSLEELEKSLPRVSLYRD